jgi:hypothetical protein
MPFDLLNRANARARIFGREEDYKAFERPLWHTAALTMGLAPFFPCDWAYPFFLAGVRRGAPGLDLEQAGDAAGPGHYPRNYHSELADL